MKAATFDGKPCKRCGGTLRYRANRQCVSCKAARGRAHYETHRDEILAKQRVYKEANPEKRRATQRRYREANRDRLNAKDRAYYETHREQKAAYHRAYFERMYWGSGVENFIYRAERAMRDRRWAGRKRVEARNQRREELASGPLPD